MRFGLETWLKTTWATWAELAELQRDLNWQISSLRRGGELVWIEGVWISLLYLWKILLVSLQNFLLIDQHFVVKWWAKCGIWCQESILRCTWYCTATWLGRFLRLWRSFDQNAMLDKCVVYVLKLAECNVVSLAYDTSKLSSWERVPHAPLRETRKNALSSSSTARGCAVLNQNTYDVLTINYICSSCTKV